MPNFFKGHGHVHALWLVVVLLAINAWNLIALPEGQIVSEYIGFASSIASLVLAIVAIFYTFTTNTNSSENLIRVTSSAERTEAAAKIILDVASEVKQSSLKIEKEVEAIAPTIAEVSGRVSAMHTILEGEAKSDRSLIENQDGKERSNLSNGAVVALMLLILAKEKSKFVDAREVFEDSTWQAFTIGYLQSIEDFRANNMVLVSEKSNFAVRDLGDLDVNAVRRIFESSVESGSLSEGIANAVTQYFQGISTDRVSNQGAET